jgi:predicted methyltransferase
MTHQARAEMNSATEAKLKQVLAGNHRSDANKARDPYRHPTETLKFFGLNQTMTVMEIWPEAGWYTEVLAPLMKGSGRYIAADFDPAASAGAKKLSDALKAKFASDPSVYGEAGTGILFPMTSKLAPAPAGSVDMVLTFRNIHNWMARDQQDVMFKSFFDVLKPGGRLGVVEHRARGDQPQDPKAKSGYVREDVAIAMAEKAGFTLVAKSEVNANPKDTKDYPKGVWTLPPTYMEGDTEKEKYRAIGESDRFTLLFEKPQ